MHKKRQEYLLKTEVPKIDRKIFVSLPKLEHHDVNHAMAEVSMATLIIQNGYNILSLLWNFFNRKSVFTLVRQKRL